MSFVKRAFDIATNVTAILAGICIVLMMAHVALDVALRAFAGKPMTGTITFVSNYYMVFLVCLPLAFIERVDAHISVEVLTGTFPHRVKTHLKAWTLPVTAIIFGLVAYATWLEAASKFALRTFVIEKDMTISIWFGYFALPAGYALLSLYLLFKFLAYLLGRPIAPEQLAGNDMPGATIND